MVKVALLVRVEAKAGKEKQVAEFLQKRARACQPGDTNSGLVRTAFRPVDIWHF